MDIEQKIKESKETRRLEKEKLLKMMFSNKSKKKVKEQFIKFKKAHKESLEVYRDVA